MSQDLLRIIDSICRDKSIEKNDFVADLEGAMASAIRKEYETEEAEVTLDLLTGKIAATVEGRDITMQELGRIAAQTAKQVIIQRTRERERGSIFEEYTERCGTIVTGSVVRIERGNLLVNLGRTEGFLPRSEQIPGEVHQIGDRIRVLVLEVRELPSQIKIILSRSHPKFIERLFELEVPEVAERIIELKILARESGYRTKVAVTSIDSKVDAVGACVGVRGSRIKNIVEELGGEKIDIVRWNESSQILIQNALKPAEVQETALCLELGKATVVVAEDQLSLAIGKRGQNVRLAARLSHWDIDILTPAEYNTNLETMERVLKTVEGVDDLLLDKLVAMGIVSVADMDDMGPDPIVEALEIEKDLGDRIVEEAGEEVIRQQERKETEEKERAEAAKIAKAAAEAGEDVVPPAEPSSFVATEEGAGEMSAPIAATVLPDAVPAETDAPPLSPPETSDEAAASESDSAIPVADETDVAATPESDIAATPADETSSPTGTEAASEQAAEALGDTTPPAAENTPAAQSDAELNEPTEAS